MMQQSRYKHALLILRNYKRKELEMIDVVRESFANIERLECLVIERTLSIYLEFKEEAPEIKFKMLPGLDRASIITCW